MKRGAFAITLAAIVLIASLAGMAIALGNTSHAPQLHNFDRLENRFYSLLPAKTA